jgi:predicted nucleic acid-binding protein
MTRVVLADTGPLYALADPSDQFHKRASAELAAIEKRGFAVAAAYPNICEAYTLVLRRLGNAYARQWLADLLAGAFLVNPESPDYALAAAQLDRFEDQPVTLVDAVITVLASRLRLSVWTFDRHFTTMRVRVWRRDPAG